MYQKNEFITFLKYIEKEYKQVNGELFNLFICKESNDFFIFMNENKNYIYENFYFYVQNNQIYNEKFNFNLDSISSNIEEIIYKYDLFDYEKKFNYLSIIVIIALCEELIKRKIKAKIFEYEEINENSFENYCENQIENDNIWYRGQSNAEWDLLPSFYRNIRLNRKIITIDYNYLINDYETKNITERYDKIFNRRTIDYRFLAYMQHAVSYSPLIDFSDNFVVATSFAVSNTSDFNIYNDKDSAIFKLSINYEDDVLLIDEDKTNNELKKFEVFLCDKYTIGNSVGGKQINTIKDFIDILTPKCLFIDIPTNDRMNYQKGKFVLFYNCLIINNKILYALNTNIRIKKIIIPTRMKQRYQNPKNIHDYLLKKYPEYKYSYMMNPYNWFED